LIGHVNKAAEELFGYPPGELLGKPVELLVPQTATIKHRADRQAFQRHPEARPMGIGRDLRGRRKDGSDFYVEVGLTPIGQRGYVLATIIDISERKQLQDSQQFLIRELQHRSKNLFAVIQVVAARSFGGSRTLEECSAAFSGRLQALANANGLLADADWSGAPLDEIINRELAPFATNVEITGCDLVVNSPAAQHLALIVHELATNAVKYGALSVPTGHVAIEGKIETVEGEPQFVWLWSEHDGPKAVEPKYKGFGSSILLDSGQQFGSYVDLTYAPEGLRYELRLPLATVQGMALPPRR
jgi:PAS domain S-box-containing protein